MEPTPQRRPGLDALRTVVVVGLVFFHSALVFDASDDFYVKNSETTEVITVFAGLGVVWAMPLLFAVAGIGSWHSMDRRGPSRYTVDRLLRLGVPLVFTVLTIVPIPQWLRTGPDKPYWRFLPEFFDVRFSPADFPFVLQGEHFETGHLWFVVLLLTFSLLLAAAVRWIPRGALVDRLAAAAQRPGVVFLPALPLALINVVLGLEEGLAGWSRWAYLLFFLYGFLFAADERFGEVFRRYAKVAAVLAVVAFGLTAPAFVIVDGDPFTGTGGVQLAGRFFFSLAGWCCMVAILGFLSRPRPVSPEPKPGPERGGGRRRLYAYLAAAAMPYYLLHQPIVVAVAYGVVPWDAPIIAEFLVIVVLSLAAILLAYEVLVRPTRVTRLLFGMREPVRDRLADPRTTS